MRCCGSADPQPLAFLQASKQFLQMQRLRTQDNTLGAGPGPGLPDDFSVEYLVVGNRSLAGPPARCCALAGRLSGRQPQLTPLRHHAEPAPAWVGTPATLPPAPWPPRGVCPEGRAWLGAPRTASPA